MTEYSGMMEFNILQFYIYTISLRRISDMIQKHHVAKSSEFFTSLLKLNYSELTLSFIIQHKLLNTTAENFVPVVIREVFSLVFRGCQFSLEFARNIVKDGYLTALLHNEMTSEECEDLEYRWLFLLKTATIQCIYQRPELKGKILQEMKDLSFKDLSVSYLSKITSWALEDETIENDNAAEFWEIISDSPEASQIIATDEKITDNLDIINSTEDSQVSESINLLNWRCGRTAGVLPKKAGTVHSEYFPKRFKIESDTLGEGAFGSVHLVIDTNQPQKKLFVAKRLSFNSANYLEKGKQEALILMKLKHKRIVQFHGYHQDKNDFFIFLEYLHMGTLSSFVSASENKRLDEKKTRHFTIQILEGVDYLHQSNILHMDIKGSNVLMKDDLNIKLTDFGISQFIDEIGVRTEQGTVRYMAPEVVYTEGNIIRNYSSRADIWSVGCTVIEMLTGKPPNSSVPTPLAILRIANSEPLHYQLPTSSSVYLHEFLNKVLNREAKQRPSADWLLKHDQFIVVAELCEEKQGSKRKKRKIQ
ncbi:uncharacterized protein LOC131944103 [Physella acuta]|uniref:uncharacterized protein LOC131944103 n=1 Tax=Physella acuta TaxID=109671 RepID=UPI0027DD709C|nr:uncharacterized protein LOC131944103 [Physella acuta]